MCPCRTTGCLTAETSEPAFYPLQYRNVRQLFQAGQVTRALLGNSQFIPDLPQPVLHPLLGKEPTFEPASYQQALEATFRADTFSH
jgi:hypothetical protein